MCLQSAQQFELGFCLGRPVEVEEVQENLTSDAGLMAFGQLDAKLGWIESFSQQISDQRCGSIHSVQSIVQQRVFGILAGYEDQNDHDSLRFDPMFKLMAGRTPDDPHNLASQPTISRLENSVAASDLLRLEEWFIDRFVESFSIDPGEITLDIDAFDDPTHGCQQLTFFHGFYGQYQYLVRAITCADNDFVAMPVLLHGSAHASIGAEEDVTRVIAKVRQRFPDLKVHVRADSGFATPRFYEALEKLPGVTYSVGYSMNPRIQKLSDELLQTAIVEFDQTKTPQRKFLFLDYQANSWPNSRSIVVKCEVNAQGTNRRAIVTNRPGAVHFPEGAYEEYADRGESENRNKELKCELNTDRLSDHRYMANLFRVMMHVLAANLLVTMRHITADPPATPARPGEIPFEAQTTNQKRQYHNLRRKRDPLGEGHACTWRTRLIKVAARIVVSTRRIRVLIPTSWPFIKTLQMVSQKLAAFAAPQLSG